jgi:hypothetical protein
MKPTQLITFFLILLSYNSYSQTVLSPGDIAIIGFSSSGRNDAVKLVTLVDLECGTSFIVTDNNWRSTNVWYCDNDEFGIQLTVTSVVLAGSVIYLDVDAGGGGVTVSTGSLSKTNLGNPWGTNFGLNSGGDNLFVLQGTRGTPSFIYGLRHDGTFATGGDCGSKNNTSKPTVLTLGTTAIQMASSQNQWHFNCSSGLTVGSKTNILSSIGNNANWTNNSTWDATNSTCNFILNDQVSYGYISGSMHVVGAGCGCLGSCDLSAIGGTNCGGGTSGDCTGGTQNVFEDIDVPIGCTYTIYGIIQRWTGCSASGADSGDGLKVDLVGGSKGFQTGLSNAILRDSYTATGPATIRISLRANRSDEIATYRVLPSTCGTCELISLPVGMIDFKAEMQGDIVDISWATAFEFNSAYFIVEKSTNTKDWEPISEILAQGNSTSIYNYHLFDSSPYEGISYYRLKQVDLDGQQIISQIISVNNSANKEKAVRYFNLMGQEVNDQATGILLIELTNGQIIKVIR